MDPKAQPQWEMSELERRLLEAARLDHVPAALGARMAEGLGVQSAAGSAAQSTPPAGGTVGAPLFAKVGLWGVLSVVLIGAVASWYGARSASDARLVAQPPRASVPSVVAHPALALPSARATGAADAATRVAAARTEGAVVPLPAAHTAALPDDAALRAEIALLDRARGALREGASSAALRLLDQHGRRFAHARLAPEAAALRIEALVQRGSHEQAEALSQQFVTTYPSHPLSAHVSKLTAAGGERTEEPKSTR